MLLLIIECSEPILFPTADMVAIFLEDINLIVEKTQYGSLAC
jgi:hypothetical protein